MMMLMEEMVSLFLVRLGEIVFVVGLIVVCGLLFLCWFKLLV